MKRPAIYIMANQRNGTLYVGATSDLIKRAYEHRQGLMEGFTKKYGCKQLVYYEQHATMDSAMEREQQIKSGSRKKKLELIERLNPHWRDLFLELS
jgi:putative endonuclease